MSSCATNPVPPPAEPEAVALFCARAQLEPSTEIAGLCARLDAVGRDELVARDDRGEYRLVEPFLAEWLRREDSRAARDV